MTFDPNAGIWIGADDFGDVLQGFLGFRPQISAVKIEQDICRQCDADFGFSFLNRQIALLDFQRLHAASQIFGLENQIFGVEFKSTNFSGQVKYDRSLSRSVDHAKQHREN